MADEAVVDPVHGIRERCRRTDECMKLNKIFEDCCERQPKTKESCEEELIDLSNALSRRKSVDDLLNGHVVRLKLNTASDITIISEKLWQPQDAADFPVRHNRVRWSRPANGATAILSFRGTTNIAICYVIKSNLDLHGLHWIEQLDLADASNHGVGAIISHTFSGGSEKAIMHTSRTLTPAVNYGQMEEGALALVFVVKKFRKLLYGRHFTLTDHKPWLSIFASKKGIPVYSAIRLQRWATILLGYDFDIRYCRTTDFGQAGALHRLIRNHQKPEEDTVIAAILI
nr:unnamed protein product [Spirometra erinaceieuropaei]